jgi:hypothetical protein
LLWQSKKIGSGQWAVGSGQEKDKDKEKYLSN